MLQPNILILKEGEYFKMFKQLNIKLLIHYVKQQQLKDSNLKYAIVVQQIEKRLVCRESFNLCKAIYLN